MYYFSYYDGIIKVIYEFCDREEVVDSFTVFDLEKINKWCNMNLAFPYELNEESLFLLLFALFYKKEKKSLLNLFKKCVLNNKIKIYCEELH